MPAPEYTRTPNLLPTLLPKLEHGEVLGGALNTLADRLREYVNRGADRLTERLRNPSPQTPTKPNQPRLYPSPRSRFRDADDMVVTAYMLAQQRHQRGQQ